MGKVTPEVRQRIVKLRETNSVKQIVEILKEDGISISDKTIYKVLKDPQSSFVSNDSFPIYSMI